MPRYRILSLDGGGSWALIQVRALQALYGSDASGHDILSRFDLVAANSGGSIVAAALAADWTLSRTLNFFLDETLRKTIFVDARFSERLEYAAAKALGIGPRYDTGRKFEGLAHLLDQAGNQLLSALPAQVQLKAGHPVDFLIVAFDYDKRRAVFFRSNPSSRAASLTPGPTAKLAEAVHASTNAPINYFDKPASFTREEFAGRRFWDGGITGMNNPVLAATIEAIANRGGNQDLEVLSIGTANVALPLSANPTQAAPLFAQHDASHLVGDFKILATSILDDPPDSATLMTHVALGQPLPGPADPLPVGNGTLVRMNPLIQPWIDAAGTATVPTVAMPGMSALEAFSELVNLDMDAVEQNQVQLIQALCDAWLKDDVPNQPIRSGANLSCEIGHRVFSTAKMAWLARAP